jgi:hypothetical protein
MGETMIFRAADRCQILPKITKVGLSLLNFAILSGGKALREAVQKLVKSRHIRH